MWGDLTKDAAKRVLWAMLYADDAGIASRSQASLENMMTAIVEVCVKKSKRGACEQKAATVLPNRTAAA